MRPLQPFSEPKFREVMAASCRSHLHNLPEPGFFLCRLERDLQDQITNSLIDPLGQPTLQLLSLVIMGKALPYLHNGIMVVDCDDDFAVRSNTKLFFFRCVHLLCTTEDALQGRPRLLN